MASENVRSEFESEIFELTAQEGQRRFFAHSDILTSHSEPFRALISGDWKDSTERKIDLTEWDGDTVAKLISFLYTGDYPYPDPTRISTEQTVLDEKPDENHSHESRKDDNSCTTRLEPFDPDKYCFKEVLLVHARIYALAQYKDIDSLHKLALDRISQTLLRIGPLKASSQAAADTIHLLSYVYSNTDPLESSEEPLRGVVSQFATENLSALQTRAEMAELVGQGGDFAKDLVAKVSKMLSPGAIKRSSVRPDYKFISNLPIKYTRSSRKPHGYVQEYRGQNADLNSATQGSVWAWLVPEYTSNPNDACTSFRIVELEGLGAAIINNTGNFSVDGKPVCINPIKDPKVSKKIIGVTLLRESSVAGSIGEFDGMTTNINADRDNSEAIYLAWNSIEV